MPAILLIDPVTGQKMHAWNGMVHPDRLLEVFGYYSFISYTIVFVAYMGAHKLEL
jgi:hypothetical protein